MNCRPHAEPLGHVMRGHQILVSCCKGITMGTLETVDEVLKRLLPHLSSRLAFLSGPSFAVEVAASLPTAVTIAAEVRHVCPWSGISRVWDCC